MAKIRFGQSNQSFSSIGGLRDRSIRWLIAAVTLAILTAVGIWTYWTVEASIQESVAENLSSDRDAAVVAVRVWFQEQETFARCLAASTRLKNSIRELLELKTPEEMRQSPAHRDAQQFFAPILRIRGYDRYRVIGRNGITLSSSEESLIGSEWKPSQPDLPDRIWAGNTVISRPHIDTSYTTPTAAMSVVTPILDDDGKPFATVSYRLKPTVLTEILEAAATGKTGEAYAFDRNGLMLTNGRFDDSLAELGLIPPKTRSMLQLELRDPGADLTKGFNPTIGKFQQPLTRPVADAVAVHPDRTVFSNVDVQGYRDYRGVRNVGAWAWLNDFDFGVVVEMDAIEAFAPLVKLERAFLLLFGLLLLSAAGVVISYFVLAAMKRQMRSAERAAKKLGQYTLERKLGEGGMGEVFIGRHSMMRRPVAVKLLRPDIANEKSLARFEREVQLTSLLQHPNTIAVYDFGRTDEGVFYYVMEYLDGMDLEHLVTKEGPLPDARVIHFLLQMCGSLGEAHALGLVHRDVKPANTMACRRGGVFDLIKVLDFGLAKDVAADERLRLTHSEAITGTPHYLAPEAIQHPTVVEPARDIYAIGAVGYFLLTGHTVFDANSVMELCRQHLTTEPTPPSERVNRVVDVQLESIVMQCLAKDPAHRPASVGFVAMKLRQCPPAGLWTADKAKDAWAKYPEIPVMSFDMTATQLANEPPSDQPKARTLKSTVSPLQATIEFAPPK